MSAFFCFVLFCFFFFGLFDEVMVLDSADSSSSEVQSCLPKSRFWGGFRFFGCFRRHRMRPMCDAPPYVFFSLFILCPHKLTSSWNLSRCISELYLKMCHIKPHLILINLTCCLVPISLTVRRFLADDNGYHGAGRENICSWQKLPFSVTTSMSPRCPDVPWKNMYCFLSTQTHHV